MSADLVYLVTGLALLAAVVAPVALRRVAVSAPMILLVLGALIGLLPEPGEVSASPMAHLALVEHLTEFCVIVALMGVGLALDRPLRLRPPDLAGFRRWAATWRMLALAMPLSIAAVALLGWSVMGLAPAAALLLGAVLAPTDPVLASDVQVAGPLPDAARPDDSEESSSVEDDDVRFALTSEAGLNDGLAFPFVYAALFLAAEGWTEGAWADWVWRWLAWELVGRVALGVLVGAALGRLLATVAFRAPWPSLRLAETGEPLLALAAVLLSYGVVESVGGYGFLAVFACAMAMRSWERGHEYHAHMHESVERLERLLTLVVLLLLGVSLTHGLLGDLGWQGALVGVLLVLVVRPLAGLLALRLGAGPARSAPDSLDRHERLAIAFFGVRGVGSLYYLAYALGETGPGPGWEADRLWATVGFTITLSVLVHGVTATPAMAWLDRVREHRSAR